MADWNLFVHPDTVDAGVSAGIRRKGFCCRETSRFLRHSVHELEQQNRSSGRIVALDIGANIGYHTIELGKLGCRVVAWELLPLNFRVLAANVRVHNLGDSVELVPRGASEGPSRAVVARMYERSTGMTTIGGGALPTAWKMDEVKGERLQVAPASDELARLGLTRVDLVKIDVEGHEMEALRGLGPSLRRLGVRFLHTEIFPPLLEANGHSAADYLRYLHQQGLRCYTRFDRRLRHRDLLSPSMFEAFSFAAKERMAHRDLFCEMGDD